ncbi:MAG: hypothetical protein ACT4R6_12530 [Gemmatimonadaceae bacterium]
MQAPPGHNTEARPGRRRRLTVTAWLLPLLIPCAVLAILRWDWPPSASAGDYAQYLAHARAIAEGRPYSDIGYIYEPGAALIGPPAYPPGLPLTLAPLVALQGIHTPLVRVLMLATLLVFAVLAALRLRVHVEPWQAAAGAALAVLAIQGAGGTDAPISDPGFAALIWATVVAVDRGGVPQGEKWTWRRVALVTALGFAAMAYRLAGIALIPALALYALTQRRRHGALFRPLAPALVWVATGAAAWATGRIAIPFSNYLIPRDLAERLYILVRQYRVALLEVELYPFPGNLWNDVYHLAATALMLIGLGVMLWRARATFLVPLLAMYVLLLLASPVAEPRYVWPFYPLLGSALALGTTIAAARLLRGRSSRATLPRSVALGSLTMVLLGALLQEGRKSPPQSLVRDPHAQELLAWLRQAAATDSLRIAFHNPRVLTLETRVSAMGLPAQNAAGQMRALAGREITHFIWQRPDEAPCLQRMANALPDSFPERFALEYVNSGFRAYRVIAAATPIAGPAAPADWSLC